MHIINMKIGQRLTLGFGIVIALLIAITILSNTQLGQLSNSIHLITKDRYPKTVLANAVQIEVNKIALNLRDIMLSSDADRIKKTGARYAGIGQENECRSRQVAAIAKTDDDKRYVQAAMQARDNYVPVRDALLKLAQEGKTEEAKTYLQDSFMPLQVKYFIALDAMFDYQGGLMDAAGSAASTESSQARSVINILAGITLLLSVAVGWLVSRSITRPLNEAVDVAKRVADGDLSTQVVIRSGDETGQLMGALKTMNDNLHHIVTRVRTGTGTIASASGEIARGNMDLSSRTEQQAGSLEETASAMEQLTSTVRQNADNARQANQLAVSASDVARQGGTVVGQVGRHHGRHQCLIEKDRRHHRRH